MRDNQSFYRGEDYRRYFLPLDGVGIATLSKPVITPAPMDPNSLATAVPIDSASLATAFAIVFLFAMVPSIVLSADELWERRGRFTTSPNPSTEIIGIQSAGDRSPDLSPASR